MTIFDVVWFLMWHIIGGICGMAIIIGLLEIRDRLAERQARFDDQW